jgi:hypothetical protein
MTYDGTALRTEAVAVGPQEVGGPAGVPDAEPARSHHLLMLPAAHSGRTGPGYRQRLREAPSRPAPRSRLTRAPAGTRAEEVPMV